jgi:hypothetical protein
LGIKRIDNFRGGDDGIRAWQLSLGVLLVQINLVPETGAERDVQHVGHQERDEHKLFNHEP